MWLEHLVAGALGCWPHALRIPEKALETFSKLGPKRGLSFANLGAHSIDIWPRIGESESISPEFGPISTKFGQCWSGLRQT